jgi:argininosuccinate synthase
MHPKVILGYSGGLDTTTAIPWLKDRYSFDVITVTIDVGQEDDFDLIGSRSPLLGAVKHYHVDAKDEFAEQYISKTIKANGLYQGEYPLSTALARPIIASKLVSIAHRENAAAIAHGCTGKGNDQIRFDLTINALDPELKVVAPVREWGLNREQEVAYLESKGFEAPSSHSEFSVDKNLWGRSVEGGTLEDPSLEVPQEALEWTLPPEAWPEAPLVLTIGFENGIPITINGKRNKLSELVLELNRIAGSYGVGLFDHVEDRTIGIKSREVYECPAATVLLKAHTHLEKLVLSRVQAAFKPLIEREWAWLVYSGLWIDPLLRNLESFLESTQEFVTGEVRVKLFKGTCRVIGRTSQYALYDKQLSTYGVNSTFDQQAAEGFIKLWGLPSVMATRRRLLLKKEVIA